jgi:hypothetical protein
MANCVALELKHEIDKTYPRATILNSISCALGAVVGLGFSKRCYGGCKHFAFQSEEHDLFSPQELNKEVELAEALAYKHNSSFVIVREGRMHLCQAVQ